MKYLILILISFNSYANRVPISEAQRYIEAAPNGVTGLYSCKDKPDEQCLDFSHIEKWEAAELIDNEVIDGFTKTKEESCNNIEDCDLKFPSLVCGQSWEPVKNYDSLSVYCTKPIHKIDGKKLVVSEAKKAAHEAVKANEIQVIKAKEDKKKAAIERLKNFDPESINGTTILQLRNQIKSVLADIVEAQK